MDKAREKDVMIYAIGLQVTYFNGQQRVRSSPDRGLKKLAEDTGGGYFELKRSADLGETFTRVANELHSQYVLGFSPGRPGWPGSQARGSREEGRDERPRPEVLRGSRAYSNEMTTVTASRNATIFSAWLEISQSM